MEVLNHMTLLEKNINVKVDLSNYTTKTHLKNAAEVDISKLAAKSVSASLKAEINKTDADKSKTVPADLGKISNAKKQCMINHLQK